MLNWGVFLDRDGVIVRQIDHLNHAEDLELIEGAGEAIAWLNDAGIPVIVVSNQAGIAKGYLTVADLEEIHERLHRELAVFGAHLDALYYCPHHPQATVTEYLKDCPCRKPGTGMLARARDEHGIDPRCPTWSAIPRATSSLDHAPGAAQSSLGQALPGRMEYSKSSLI